MTDHSHRRPLAAAPEAVWRRLLPAAAVAGARRRRLLLVPAAVHQHLRGLGDGPGHDRAADRDPGASLAIWNLATYQFVMVATMPGMTLRQATVSTETTTAVSNTVVGGAAIALGLTYAMNSSWGFSRSRTSVSLLVSGLWNNFAKLGLPVLGAGAARLLRTTTGRLLAGLLGVAPRRRRRPPRPAAAQRGGRRPHRPGPRRRGLRRPPAVRRRPR